MNRLAPAGKYADTPVEKDVCAALRAMRMRAGLTQEELGERMGWATKGPNGRPIQPPTTRYESGKRIASFEVFKRWADACGAEVAVTVWDANGQIAEVAS